MLVPTLVSAGFALTANAFLLPPEVVEAANKVEATKNNIVPALINPRVRNVNLDCSGCPFALSSQRNGLHEWTNSVNSDLELKFIAEDDKLKLNGVPFYPISPPFAPAPLTTKQIEKGEDGSAFSQQGYHGELRLSYSLEVGDRKKNLPAPGQDATATEMTLSILGLDNEVVHVNDIKIKALSLPNPTNGKHELFIVSIDTEASDSNAADAKCATIFCRVMYKFRGAMGKARTHAKSAAYKVKCICIKCINTMRHGHHGRPAHPVITPSQAGQPVHLPTHNRVHPGHFKPHHHGHRHHRSWVHTFARASKQVFSFVLLPILIGIVFGVVASAIGMLVGQVIVAIWLRLRRRSSNNVAYECIESEEKEGLPKYEDLEDSKTGIDEEA
ncbi:MAG: hypothetical protein Q9170_000190 [Blastenia crenularia]